jgi:hypothetical protein
MVSGRDDVVAMVDDVAAGRDWMCAKDRSWSRNGPERVRRVTFSFGGERDCKQTRRRSLRETTLDIGRQSNGITVN